MGIPGSRLQASPSSYDLSMLLPQTDISTKVGVFFLKFKRRTGDLFSSGHGAGEKKELDKKKNPKNLKRQCWH